MIYLYSFLFAGFVCLIGQIIYEKTKLSPGHITSLFVVIGAILGIFGVYEWLVKYVGGGANVLITNFGYLLVKGGVEGVRDQGILGYFLNVFKYCSFTLSFTIIISIISGLVTKPKGK